jgi:hypothetical protein
MKTMFIFIAAFLLGSICIAQSVTISCSNHVCGSSAPPGTDQGYVANLNNTGCPNEPCKFNWSVTNGVITHNAGQSIKMEQC